MCISQAINNSISLISIKRLFYCFPSYSLISNYGSPGLGSPRIFSLYLYKIESSFHSDNQCQIPLHFLIHYTTFFPRIFTLCIILDPHDTDPIDPRTSISASFNLMYQIMDSCCFHLNFKN